MSNTAALLLALSISLALYGFQWSRSRSKLQLPPGPRKLPLLGNVFDIPSNHPWKTYMAWSKQYDSDILHLSVAGASVVVLNSLKATDSLLEKRSSIYSDRPRLPMVNELMGWNFNIGMPGQGQRLRAHRRLFRQGFTPKTSMKYRPKQIAATHRLLQRFQLHNPDTCIDHLRQWASEVIMSVAYGIDVLPVGDPYVELAREAVHTLAAANIPGKYLVDSIPNLKYVPAWLPGAGFKRKANGWSKLARAMRDVPFEETKRQMEAGTAPFSCAAESLNALKESEDNYYTEDTIKAATGTMYIGGSDTTVSAVGGFLLGMLSNPEAQRKAQAEVDLVTKGQYLPDFDDEASMPYVAAVVKEVLRWKPVTPIAIPHFVRVEDEYKGYRIPAGSLVIGNAWAILHDEVTYPDPYAFNPDRFLLNGKLNPAVQDPEVTWGFGRRLCPGRHMATASIWIAVASILATFDISKAVDENGKEVEPSYEYHSGFISLPLPFKCVLTPRSEKAKALIQATANETL
ncbi:cytochrome P450 [Mycena maculata]|uniref:Cytochrome P450 n=1 Tax=Mycena maculata TaxID=230809 RepID=A0AAD7HLK8_9AGAR|nr:cytochrome P450 [Mycena maculata]